MSYLIDTNILLRSSEPNHPMFGTATSAVSLLLKDGKQLYIMPQNLIEFWNVCTRPQDRNGLGYSTSKTYSEIQSIKSLFSLLSQTSTIYTEWEKLVNNYQVKGVSVHDTHLVAAMLVHNLTHIVTFNVNDFRRYQEITAVNPQDIIKS